MGFGNGSDISWTICEQSDPSSRQITTPTPHQSFFTGRMLFLARNQRCQSTWHLKVRKMDIRVAAARDDGRDGEKRRRIVRLHLSSRTRNNKKKKVCRRWRSTRTREERPALLVAGCTRPRQPAATYTSNTQGDRLLRRETPFVISQLNLLHETENKQSNKRKMTTFFF